MLERSWTSLMQHLPARQALSELESAEEVRSDSCQFDCAHQKSFSFLGINIDLLPLARRCQGTCNHVRIQGAYTTSSATYVPKLAYVLLLFVSLMPYEQFDM